MAYFEPLTLLSAMAAMTGHSANLWHRDHELQRAL